MDIMTIHLVFFPHLIFFENLAFVAYFAPFMRPWGCQGHKFYNLDCFYPYDILIQSWLHRSSSFQDVKLLTQDARRTTTDEEPIAIHVHLYVTWVTFITRSSNLLTNSKSSAYNLLTDNLPVTAAHAKSRSVQSFLWIHSKLHHVKKSLYLPLGLHEPSHHTETDQKVVLKRVTAKLPKQVERCR